MAAQAYFDKTLSKEAAASLLTQIGAKAAPGRSQPGKKVYTINGGGEAMVEVVGGQYRVRCYKGQCPC